MAVTLKIDRDTGGAGIDFINNPAYRVTSWAPAVATRRVGELGGRGPYGEVVEEMTLFIGATPSPTPSTPAQNLSRLFSLMDQAERWSRGERVAPVKLVVKMTATSPELSAVILGPASPGEAMIELPPRYGDAAAMGALDPVILRFRRSALWLGDSETKTTPTGANPATLTATGFIPRGDIAPLKIELLNISVPQSNRGVNGFILTAWFDKQIVVIDSESFTDTADTATVSDAANFAMSGNVKRFTPDTSGGPLGFMDLGRVNVAALVDLNFARRWGLFVNCRNNSATNTFYLQPEAREYYNGGRFIQFPRLAIPPTSTFPQWLYVGSVTTKYPLKSIELWGASDTNDGTLDIDSVVLLALDNPDTSRAIALTNNQSFPTYPGDLIIDHQLNAELTPLVVFDTVDEFTLNYRGDATIFATAGTVAACLLATDGSKWRLTNNGGSVQSLAFRITRTNGYLTLE
ncbi:protein of unknown function [Candidatus Promineifilum breve]|uniref:Uncharacterized protein n=1 Tax=Candidatus Promineifilum breve TaxID=1806508 RepID=A0A160T4X8_9CHLR|nr:hypothetical protein [Candidatus Promineifilum breve]CUS05401.2 protein of unknown function [Candidatus Promineifilum breve]